MCDHANFFQHGGLKNIAGLRRDANHGDKFGAENLVDLIGPDHIGMGLRQHTIGIDNDLEVLGLHYQTNGNEQHSEDHQPAYLEYKLDITLQNLLLNGIASALLVTAVVIVWSEPTARPASIQRRFWQAPGILRKVSIA